MLRKLKTRNIFIVNFNLHNLRKWAPNCSLLREHSLLSIFFGITINQSHNSVSYFSFCKGDSALCSHCSFPPFLSTFFVSSADQILSISRYSILCLVRFLLPCTPYICPLFFLCFLFSVLSMFSSLLFSIARIIHLDKDQNIDESVAPFSSQSREGRLLLMFKVSVLQCPFGVHKSFQKGRLGILLYSLIRSKHIFQFSGNDR